MIFTENLKGVSGIYCAIHRATGLCYVGSSINIWKRYKEHLYKSRRGSMTRFAVALRIFGETEFDFEVLERCPKESLLARERFYIVLLDAAELDGFNSRENPCATYDAKMSAITRARISASKKGLPRLPEHRRAQSIGQTGLKRSEEFKSRIRDALRGRPKSDSHRRNIAIAKIGIKRSEEAKAKTSASLKGRVFSKETLLKQAETRRLRVAALGPEYADNRKPIIAIDSDGNVLHVFESLLEACGGLNMSNGNVRYYLKTGRPTRVGLLLYYATIVRQP